MFRRITHNGYIIVIVNRTLIMANELNDNIIILRTVLIFSELANLISFLFIFSRKYAMRSQRGLSCRWIADGDTGSSCRLSADKGKRPSRILSRCRRLLVAALDRSQRTERADREECISVGTHCTQSRHVSTVKCVYKYLAIFFLYCW